MSNKMRAFLVLIPILLFQSCQCGGNQNEISLEVSYSGIPDKPRFSRVVAEGANRFVSLSTIVEDLDTFSVFRLPVNSNQDSVRFFMYGAKGVDTVVITYSRRFEFRSNRCGYAMFFENERVRKNTISREAWLYLDNNSAMGGNFESKIEFRN